MMKKYSYLLIIAGLMCACTHQTSDYNFDNTHSIKIDESKVVLTRFPSVLKDVNDSIIAVINSAQKLSLYNINSGINISNFSTEKINFDSLIKETFQKKFEGKREYIYDTSTAGGLSDANCQVLSFDYSNNAFYIYLNTLVQVNYINDSVELLKYSQNEKVKQLKKENGQDINLQIMQYLEFIVVVDEKMNLKEIIPLYEKPELKQEKYSSFYQKGFAINGNKIYVPIQKDNQSFEKITSKLKWDSNFYTLAQFNVKGKSKTDYKLSFTEIDFRDFSLHDYFSSFFVYQRNSNELIFSNGKEICEIESGEKLFSKNQLKTNEWVQNFFFNSNKNIVMVTYTLDKKANPTEFEINYGVDSLSRITIKIFDLKNMNWGTKKQLPITSNLAFLVTKNKIVYFDKDKEHYYLKYILYNEN